MTKYERLKEFADRLAPLLESGRITPEDARVAYENLRFLLESLDLVAPEGREDDE